MSEQTRQKNPVRLLMALLILAIGFYLLIGGIRSATDGLSPLVTPNKTVITIETVDTKEERQLGLSGRESLADEMGMLFIFDGSTSANCFWMKDMKFAIDMVWLDEQKRVITVTEDVAPDTFPESFCPTGEAAFGLELATGRASELGIAVGETLKF